VEGLRRMHNEELHNLYASSNIFRIMKLRRIRCVEDTAHMGKTKNTKFWSENLKGRGNTEETGVNGRIISEWILGK
jgi:hypothetical protein